MIARDNHTRDSLNAAARELWRALGLLGEERTYGSLPLAEGERVICRRNDRMIEVDNGMRGTVRHLERDRVVIETDGGLARELSAAYVSEHLEHAYALTGHGMQGGTVERAIVVASPHDLTAGWSYTALSRARGETRLLIHDHEAVAERGDFAPGDRARTASTDLLTRVERHMRERDDEDLAIEQLPAGPDEIERAIAAPNGGSRHGTATRRALQRIEDLHDRALRLTAQYARLTQRLEALPEPTRRGRDAQAVERAHLEAALRECARELEMVLDERTSLLQECGVRSSVSVKRDRQERSTSPGNHECRELGEMPRAVHWGFTVTSQERCEARLEIE